MCNRTASRLLVAALLLAAPAAAQDVLQVSPDTTVELGLSKTVVSDDDIAVRPGVLFVSALEGLAPPAADLSAYGATTGTGETRLLSYAKDVELPGGLVARAGDVVKLEGGVFSLELDGSAAGLPLGVAVDAVTESDTGLLVSFDTSVSIGAGVVADDEDIVEWDGASFSLVLDGSAVGVDRALDVDGAQFLGTQKVAVSFDASGSVGGVTFEDEDILTYDAGLGSWTLEYDVSSFDSAWRRADVDAVFLPEPSGVLGFAAGIGLLAVVRRRGRPLPRRS